MEFWLGTHRPNWLGSANVPLMVSHRLLGPRKTLPRAVAPWVCDSGGFTELFMFGEWRTDPDEYVKAVKTYEDEIGQLAWAAPQDWMCEPFVVAKTGLSVGEHQRRTVENFLTLDGRGPFIPVLQGWERDDYHRHVEMYDKAGVDLTRRSVVGLGSVCRRANTTQIVSLLVEMSDLGIRLHGFGVKRKALAAAAPFFTSADSMAWSFTARRAAPLAGCSHRSCTNCMEYALRWRAATLKAITEQRAVQPMLNLRAREETEEGTR